MLRICLFIYLFIYLGAGTVSSV